MRISAVFIYSPLSTAKHKSDSVVELEDNCVVAATAIQERGNCE